MTSLPLRNQRTLPESERLRKAIAERYLENQSSNEAFAALQQLATRYPTSIPIRLDLVRLAQQRCEFDQAKTSAMELLQLAGNDPAIVDSAADALAAAGDHKAIRDAWLSLSEYAEYKAIAYTALAGAAFHSNRLDEADQWISQAMTVNSDNGMTQLLAGQIALKTGNLDLAAQRLEQCTRTDTPAIIRFRALYQTGELKDQTGDFTGAVAAWRAAKQCIATEMGPQVEKARKHRRQRLARNQKILEQLTPQTVKRHIRSTPPRTPSMAILAGHPRSGTTLLEQVIAAHPLVRDLDEIDVLSATLRSTLLEGRLEFVGLDTINQASTAQLATIRADYLRRCTMLLGRLSKQNLLLDKNPNYTDSLPLAISALPGLKILVARRDPRDILLSCFRLPVTPESANIGWLNQQDLVEDYRSMMAVWERLRDCLAGETNWLEVEYEKLCTEFDKTARQVTQFLGLNWHKDQQNYRTVRQQARINSPNFTSAKQPVHTASLGRWQRYADLLPELFEPFTE